MGISFLALTLPGSGPSPSEEILCARKMISAVLSRALLGAGLKLLAVRGTVAGRTRVLFPVLGEANDAIAEQFRKFEAFTNSQHHGLESCKKGKKQVLAASLSIPTVHLGCILR